MSRVKKTTGPPSTLTKEVALKIKECVLEGKNMKEIAKTVGISDGTLYSWRHYNQDEIADKMNTWEAMYQLRQADKFSKELMAMLTVDEKGRPDKGLLAIKQKESEFLREKLIIARDKYNSGNVVNVNVALPQPIIDLSKVVSTVNEKKSLTE
jgi:transposase-like protein